MLDGREQEFLKGKLSGFCLVSILRTLQLLFPKKKKKERKRKKKEKRH